MREGKPRKRDRPGERQLRDLKCEIAATPLQAADAPEPRILIKLQVTMDTRHPKARVTKHICLCTIDRLGLGHYILVPNVDGWGNE